MSLIFKKPYRYAIYFAPKPEGDWWNAGCEWLGRCAVHEKPIQQSYPSSITPEKFMQLTAAPRRYGWHATIKAPFILHGDVAYNQLKEELALICAQFKPFTLPKLQVNRLDDFLALTPMGDTSEISRVERTCVTQLHRLAAPMPPDELLRRRTAGLSLAKDSMLLKWGYPHVLDYFRFHMSLTGPLRDCSERQIQALIHFATEKFDALPACQFESLAIFAEPERGADFVLLEHCSFAG